MKAVAGYESSASNDDPTPANNNNNNGTGIICALPALSEDEVEKYKRIQEARTWIGVVVTKIFSSVRSLGNVADYDQHNDLFEVGYDNGRNEMMDRAQLMRILAHPFIVQKYHRDIQAGNGSEKEKATRKPTECGGPYEMYMVRPNNKRERCKVTFCP